MYFATVKRKKRDTFVLFVSFRVRMYSHTANEKSGRMVKGRRKEQRKLGLQRKQKEDWHGAGRLQRGSSEQRCWKEVSDRRECSRELNQVKLGKDPLVSGTWRSVVTLERRAADSRNQRGKNG